MLTREMGAVKVKAMGKYISIPQKSLQERKAPIKEKLEYATVEEYLEEVVNPVKNQE